ncbi:DUF6471 domain-containing protein [Parvularcula oceani]|uniref:DUF6471 domain-containing protein n=1 Tax=Parvularcula oceani TaxID=1247963 RepID=UPI0004E0CB5B|nr:DUF6471 domain-containing protein [Parvularcula oceani]
MSTATASKRSKPPAPSKRKDDPVLQEYEERAKATIRAAMKERDADMKALTEGLAALGVRISEGGLANKISRGSFSAAFLLQCLDVLGVAPPDALGREK